MSLKVGFKIGGLFINFKVSVKSFSIDLAKISIASSLGAGKHTSKSCVTLFPTNGLAFLKFSFETCVINLLIKISGIKGIEM